MKKITALVALIGIISSFISCTNSSIPSHFDYGQVTENVYSNSFFNLKMNIPESWVVQSEEQKAAILSLGKDLMEQKNSDLKDIIEVSEVNSAYLLMVFEDEVGASLEYNSNFLLVAENLQLNPGIKSGEGYLFHTKKMFKQANLGYSFKGDFQQEMINNQEFYSMKLSQDYLGQSIQQTYYSTISNGFALTLIVSFLSPEQEVELDNVVQSITFQ